MSADWFSKVKARCLIRGRGRRVNTSSHLCLIKQNESAVNADDGQNQKTFLNWFHMKKRLFVFTVDLSCSYHVVTSTGALIIHPHSRTFIFKYQFLLAGSWVSRDALCPRMHYEWEGAGLCCVSGMEVTQERAEVQTQENKCLRDLSVSIKSSAEFDDECLT